ncbi:MAG: radical SAM protein [Candidatus Zixiibacteriota bacterium]|nr:MAG: radical SAM protein [candidate division Zixibacteria bacterium]
MKVLFIRPGTDIPLVPPPMGLLYLSACLRQAGDHQARIVDGRLLELSPEQVIARGEDFDPDVVAISALTMEGPAAHQIAAAARRRWPGRTVLLGGPYPTSEPEKAASDPNVDVSFIGEAEHNFTAWLQAQAQGGDLASVPAIAFRRNGEVAQNPHGGFVEDLDRIPFPAWDLLDLDKYFEKKFLKYRTMNPHQMRSRAVPMVTSRGCPYRCSYCHNLFGKKLRHRSVQNVIDEMVMLKQQHGIQEIEFIDDIFNLDIPRAKAIFRQVIDRRLDLTFAFPNGLRSDSFDDELLEIMKKGGAYRLVFAIESGSPRIQKAIRKNLDLEKARANIEKANKLGYFLGGFFILGFPDETEEEAWQTINFALNSKLHTANFFILTPFPNTEVWDQALSAGMPVNASFEHYYQVSVNLSRVPSERLEELRRKAIARFFLNPVRILRFITRVPNFWRRSVEMFLILALTLVGKWKK